MIESLSSFVQGGFKAVLWADTLQMVIMVGGFAATTITGIVHQGGLSKVLEDARISGRMDAVELV